MNTFTAGSCVRFGWETFKKRPWFLIGASLLFFIVVGIVTTILNELITYGGVAAFLGVLARAVLEMLTGMGSIAFALKAHDDIEHVTLMDFWRPFPFWKYTAATLLFGLICAVGLILVIIPGIIWGIMFGFAGYLVIDKKMWPVDALKESKRMTYGYKWELFLFGIFSLLIVLVGVVCLLVGFLASYPIITIASAHAFRELQARSMRSASTVTA